MSYLPYGEACRWDEKSLKRAGRVPTFRKLSLPRKDDQLRQLGRGLVIDEPDGPVFVQVWDRASWSLVYSARKYGATDLFWVRVYDGWRFPGEFRLLTVYANGTGLSAESYNASGHKAHADGSSCYGYPCSGCPTT